MVLELESTKGTTEKFDYFFVRSQYVMSGRQTKRKSQQSELGRLPECDRLDRQLDMVETSSNTSLLLVYFDPRYLLDVLNPLIFRYSMVFSYFILKMSVIY